MSNSLPTYYLNDPDAPLDLLVVVNSPSSGEESSGQWLTSQEGELLADYLGAFDPPISWGVTSLFPESTSSATAKQVKDAAPALFDTIHGLQPRCILALGSSVVRALWPADAGKVQGVTKAKALDLVWCGIPMVASMDPKVHTAWLKSNGSKGQPLTDEYPRAFIKVGELLAGTYTPLTFGYTDVDSKQAADWLIARAQDHNVKLIGFDTEDTTWWGNGLKPHQWPEGLPDKLTLWHEDTELSWCSVCWTNPQGVRETYSLHPDIMTPEFVIAMFSNRTMVAWNILYEIASMRRFRNVDLCDPRWNVGLYDGMVRYGIRDQSIVGLGLKDACAQHIGAPAWDLNLKAELMEGRKRRLESHGVSISAIDDVDARVAREYNAADSFYMMVFVEDWLLKDLDGGLHPESRAFECVTESLPFFAGLEATGILVDLDHVNAVLDEREGVIEELQAQIVNHESIRYVLEVLGEVEFNARKPIHFQALVAATYGNIHPRRDLNLFEQTTLKAEPKRKALQNILLQALEVPEWAPMSESGKQLASGADIIEMYATRTAPDSVRNIWRLLHSLKKAQDDAQKFYTILNYTSGLDSRIHTSYRIVRSANEAGSANSETGTTSGRVSTTPNLQNQKDDPEIRACFPAPPGYTIVANDLKGAEMVVIGATTGDELFSSWALQGKDTHLEKAAILWGYHNKCNPELFFQFRSREEATREGPSDEQTPWRKLGKTLNFADLYMQAPSTFAGLVGITEEEAIEKAEESRRMAPGIYRAQCELYDRFQAGAPSVTKIFGRVRYAHTSKFGWRVSEQTAEEFLEFGKVEYEHQPDGTWKPVKIVKRKKDFANLKTYRSIWNAFGAQSDANDITTWQGMRFDRAIRTQQVPAGSVTLFNFIHDALYFYVRNDVLAEARPWIKTTMEDLSQLPAPLGLPLRSSQESGTTLAELH